MATNLPDGSPTNFHEALTDRVQRLMMPRGLSSQSRDGLILATSAGRDQPDFRPQYFKGMMGGWMMLQVGVTLAMAVLDAATVVLDKHGLHAVASLAAGLEAFCISGTLISGWWYYAARRAARSAHHFGTSSDEYRRAAARATSSGGTIPYQTLLGVAVMVIGLAL